jgi:type IV secretory pathway TraG/TraD family ATPase VirD4
LATLITFVNHKPTTGSEGYVANTVSDTTTKVDHSGEASSVISSLEKRFAALEKLIKDGTTSSTHTIYQELRQDKYCAYHGKGTHSGKQCSFMKKNDNPATKLPFTEDT